MAMAYPRMLLHAGDARPRAGETAGAKRGRHAIFLLRQKSYGHQLLSAALWIRTRPSASNERLDSVDCLMWEGKPFSARPESKIGLTENPVQKFHHNSSEFVFLPLEEMRGVG